MLERVKSFLVTISDCDTPFRIPRGGWFLGGRISDCAASFRIPRGGAVPGLIVPPRSASPGEERCRVGGSVIVLSRFCILRGGCGGGSDFCGKMVRYEFSKECVIAG
jgi:hypothetical protein